jgi:serine/threonine protein kinase
MIGNVVGNYKITEKLGEGGMGTVFKGVDLMLEREVAIKSLRPELASQPQVVERFRSEAVTLAKLNHPNIAALYTFFRQGDDFFMVMEFMRGRTLDQIITASGALTAEQTIPLFCQALEGIGYAHKMGIVHRDIKPANMMLTEDGTLKVMDFGIARMLGTARMTKAGNLIGTVEYMSPEQIQGKETDARSDIYSMGVLLYELLTGRMPYISENEYELMKMHIEQPPPQVRLITPHVPQVVEETIMRAMAKDPNQRFQTAGEFRSILLSTGLAAGTVDIPLIGQITVATPTSQPSVSHPYINSPVSKETNKETRIASGPNINATRMAPSPLIPDVGAVPPASLPQGVAPPANPSFLSKLNWKHFAGAAAVLLILIGLPAVLLIAFALSSKKSSAPKPVVNKPDNKQVITDPQQVLPAQSEPKIGPPPAGLPAAEQPIVTPVENSPIASTETPKEEKQAPKKQEPVKPKQSSRTGNPSDRERKIKKALELLDQ